MNKMVENRRLFRFARSMICYDQQANVFNVPPLEQLLTYRVVISTASAASSLVGVGVPASHFSHILIGMINLVELVFVEQRNR